MKLNNKIAELNKFISDFLVIKNKIELNGLKKEGNALLLLYRKKTALKFCIYFFY
jgi:hypothetical protein